jgi:PAS domain S-box-containing protein
MTVRHSNLFGPKDRRLIFNAIMEHSKDGLFVTDHDGKVMLVNSAYADMFDVNAAEIIGSSVRDIVNRGTWSPNLFEQVIKSERIVSLIQTTHRGKNILSTGTPIFDDAKRIRFVLFNDRDITHLDKLIGALERKELKDGLIQFIFSGDDKKISDIGEFVAESPAMADILKTVVRASKFNIPLMLNGETGVGKSKIARLVHDLSERKGLPFVDINCGAIPEALLESELFGYERGAFTGAAPTGKKGLFEIAHGGTLFLDEVSELPLPMQVKLFKFIETGELMRVGGVSPTQVNTRVIAATNRDLKAMTHRGEFRSELFFRLNVVPIYIPPLRERREDIIALTELFFESCNKKFNTQKRISKSVQQELCSYSFPGNVRELENLVKRLVAMTENDYIRIKHLPEYLQRLNAEDSELQKTLTTPLPQTIATIERKIIQSAIQKYGSQKKAAKVLGLNQSTLSRKLKE